METIKKYLKGEGWDVKEFIESKNFILGTKGDYLLEVSKDNEFYNVKLFFKNYPIIDKGQQVNLEELKDLVRKTRAYEKDIKKAVEVFQKLVEMEKPLLPEKLKLFLGHYIAIFEICGYTLIVKKTGNIYEVEPVKRISIEANITLNGDNKIDISETVKEIKARMKDLKEKTESLLNK